MHRQPTLSLAMICLDALSLEIKYFLMPNPYKMMHG